MDQVNFDELSPNEQLYYIAHYGVKGMKWGVRRKRSLSGRAGKKGITDTKAFKTLIYDKTKAPFTAQGRAYQRKRRAAEKAARKETIAKVKKATSVENVKKSAKKVNQWMLDNQNVMVAAGLVASVGAMSQIKMPNYGNIVKK